MRLPAFLLAALCALVAGIPGAGAGSVAPDRSSPAITRAELHEHLAALQRIADRNGGNRSAGTSGFDRSADYVAARLANAGWTVTRQEVPFTYFALRRASLWIGG